MMFKQFSRVVFAAALAGSAIHAQSTTQGAIAGTAEDATGAVIPKAMVTIHNDGTNAQLKLTADDSGYFKAPLLEPGTYTVTVAAPNFGTDQIKAVVAVGKLTEVQPHLKTGSTETTVEVTADQPVLNFDSPDVNEILNREAIDNVPVQNRRWSALALTTPGVVADSSGFGLISVRGLSTLLNNIEIDGADDNQAYYSEERGRTREAYSTSENAVSEFEVNTGVYSAQFGRAAGGVINSVTRSGTNAMHGELFFNDLDRGFGAYVPGSIAPSGAPLKPKDLRKIYGGALGGAIIKDKLFWFYTYDQQTRINPAIAKVRSYGSPSTVGSFLEQPDATVTSCTAAPATGTTALSGAVTVAGAGTHAALDTQVCALSLRQGITYANAVTLFDNALSGPAGLTSDLGTVQRAGYQEINTPKLDWQINGKQRASFLFHRLRWDAPGDVQTTSSANYSLDAFGQDFVKLDYGLAKLDSLISSHLTNEVLYQYSRELDDEGQQPYSAYTLSNLVAPGQNGSGFVNGPGGTIPYINLNQSNNGFYLGSPYYSYRQALPDERKWQVEDILYYSIGNHSIRLGADFVHNSDLIHQEPYYFGNYSYSSVANYVSDLASKGKTPTCNYNGSGVAEGPGTTTITAAAKTGVVIDPVGAYPCYSSVSQDFGATSFAISTLDYAGFIQDNWKAIPRLTLELGVRYDFEQLPAATANLTSATGSFVPYSDLLNHPQDRNNFGPRIGFSYDVFGTGLTVLRGGYGLYYGRILNGSVLNVLFGSGSPNGQYATASLSPATAASSTSGTTTTTTESATSGAAIFPNPISAAGGSKPSSFYLAPNLQNPAVHEMTLSVQQQLGKGTVFGLQYLGALGRTLPNFLDTNLAAPPASCTVQSASCPAITISDSAGAGRLANGSVYLVPTFSTANGTAGYVNPNFSNITGLFSNITSNYHSMTVEIQNRSFHSLQFDANYTWAHALDYNQNATSTTSTNNWLNPYAAQRQNYGISQFNVGNRFVGYVLYTFPSIHGNSMLKYLANGWSINDTFQAQNGLPYSASISSNRNSSGALNTGSWNGAPGVSYIPVIGLNTYEVPRAMVDDVRLQKSFTLHEHYELQLNADMYNAANHQNYSTSDITTTAYNYASANTATSSTLTYSPRTSPYAGFGSHTTSNDSGFLYTPREIQIGARLQF